MSHEPFRVLAPASPAVHDLTGLPAERLRKEIARLSDLSGGTAGVSAIHLETGGRIGWNDTERFPMASVYKIPIALKLLSLVDAGSESLDRNVDLQARDFRIGSGLLTDHISAGGLSVSIRNLLELMLTVSDNTASDLLMELAGGPIAVTGFLTDRGIEGISIDRPTSWLIANYQGLETLPPEEEWTPERLLAICREVEKRDRETPETGQEAGKRYDEDPRDTAMPAAMTALLARLSRGEFLSPANTDLLLGVMSRCQTGLARLRGLLLTGAEVADKTGSLGNRIANDAGIVCLPHDAGHVAVAVFLKGATSESPGREAIIAHISRSIHDFFLFHA